MTGPYSDAVLRGAEQDSFEATVARLSKLPPHEYDQARKAEAERLDVRVGTLDEAVEKARPAPEAEPSEGKGSALELPHFEPWHEPVGGAALFDEISTAIRAHVVLSPAQADAAALWCGHAHALDLSWFNPRLAARSPVKRCGKTTLLEVISSITPRSLPASNISAAAVFRTIEACQPTLIIDEADTFLGAEHQGELRGILNAGHTRTAAFVIRVVPTSAGELEPRKFSVWSPIAVGMIGKLPGTLADRSVEITLQRKRAGDKVKKFRLDRVEHLHTLGRKIARFVQDSGGKIRAADPEPPAVLHDRAADNWRPLMAIAEVAGGDWLARARKAALEVQGASDDADERGVQLLGDIKTVFDDTKAEALWTEELLRHLHAMSERPWCEYGRHRKPITPRDLSALLKPFEIRSRQVRKGETNKNGYECSDLEGVFSRYLGAESPTTLQAAETAAFSDFRSSTPGPSVEDANRPKPAETATCRGVEDKRPEPGGRKGNGHAHGHGWTCAHCRDPVEPGPGCTATSDGEWFHNGCVDPWSRDETEPNTVRGVR
jgi:Protein of unknown function (DUF3631)